MQVKYLLWILIFFFYSNVLASYEVDITPPVCSLSPAAGSYPKGPFYSLAITAVDPVPASGVSSISVTGITLPTPTPTSTTDSLTQTYSWNPNSDTYSFTVTATDKAGNTNTSCATPTYTIYDVSPWIQTTGGDVHSNTRINLPGGP